MQELLKLLDNGKMLFENFGWFSVLLVLGTTLIMLPINMLYKKLMKKESLQRLRKTISCFSVYVVAFALIALFTSIATNHTITFGYLFSTSINCGLMSMLLWAIIKFARDYGVLPLINIILTNKEAKKWLKELGIDNSLVNLVNKKIEQYIKDKNIVSIEDYIKNEMLIANQVRTQLNGFVANEKINEVVNNILQPIKNKLK